MFWCFTPNLVSVHSGLGVVRCGQDAMEWDQMGWEEEGAEVEGRDLGSKTTQGEQALHEKAI